jgi:uncharacterized protein (DUF1778 family)
MATKKPRKVLMNFKLSPADRAAVKMAAEAAGLTMADFLRTVLREKAIAILSAQGRPVPTEEGASSDES